MIKKNPLLQRLIDELDLVLVDASHIASDDKNPPQRRRAEAEGCSGLTRACP